jgi:hypothetical protein
MGGQYHPVFICAFVNTVRKNICGRDFLFFACKIFRDVIFLHLFTIEGVAMDVAGGMVSQ